jgi:beta-lactam-binding protein with PASTA domain
VPNVIGMTLEDAKAALQRAGYTVDRVDIQPGSPPGAKVVRCDPPAGALRPAANATVDLTLGTHP